jgi:hypothetical protein
VHLTPHDSLLYGANGNSGTTGDPVCRSRLYRKSRGDDKSGEICGSIKILNTPARATHERRTPLNAKQPNKTNILQQNHIETKYPVQYLLIYSGVQKCQRIP